MNKPDFNIYGFESYKDFLRALVYKGTEHGMITRLAKISGCQRSYLSRVLGGKVHLTPDQLFHIAQHFQYTDDEYNYLQLLLEKDRAGSKSYQDYLKKLIHEKQNEQQLIKKRLHEKQSLAEESTGDLSRYYSHWAYAAIHIASSISDLQTIAALASYLNLPRHQVESILMWLVQQGLVEQSGHKYRWISGNIHIDKFHPFANLHHINWRLRSIANIEDLKQESLHYSVVQSLSREDFSKLKKLITDFIAQFDKTARPSKPEILTTFNVSFFEMGLN